MRNRTSRQQARITAELQARRQAAMDRVFGTTTLGDLVDWSLQQGADEDRMIDTMGDTAPEN